MAMGEPKDIEVRPSEETKTEEAKPEQAAEAAKPQERRGRAEDNVIFVGKKPTMSYVLAAMTQFSDGFKEIHLKARGRSISRAVDVAEVIRSRFVKDLRYNISIGTEEVHDKEKENIKVSTIDISVEK